MEPNEDSYEDDAYYKLPGSKPKFTRITDEERIAEIWQDIKETWGLSQMNPPEEDEENPPQI